LQRINLQRDVHFYTHTTIDTLDYSGSSLNSGSKVVFAAYGDIIRTLATGIPTCCTTLTGFFNAQLVLSGIIVLQANAFTDYETAAGEMKALSDQLSVYKDQLAATPFIIVCDDASFVSNTLNNFLWVTFTRCNPSHDIHGIDSFTANKHWGCNGPVVLDARIKPHHAPPVEKDPVTEKNIDRFFEKGGSLYGVI